MSTSRMSLFGSNESSGKIYALPKEFTEYQRKLRNINYYKDEEVTDEMIDNFRKDFPNKDCILTLENGYKVAFEAFPDYQTGFGHLHISLMDNNDLTLITNEAISDGLGGERKIKFDINDCYGSSQFAKDLKPFEIIVIL